MTIRLNAITLPYLADRSYSLLTLCLIKYSTCGVETRASTEKNEVRDYSEESTILSLLRCIVIRRFRSLAVINRPMKRQAEN